MFTIAAQIILDQHQSYLLELEQQTNTVKIFRRCARFGLGVDKLRKYAASTRRLSNRLK